MPLVQLRYDKGSEGPSVNTAARLAEALPNIVASALTIDGADADHGRLVPSDIRVTVDGSWHDVNAHDLEIMIFAHEYPERQANLEARRKQIVAGIREFFSGFKTPPKGGVQIQLGPSEYGTF